MMTLQQLEYIVALNRYRNFAEAAKNCFVTQPTLSMQIQKLEDYLQVTIFDRTKQPVIPTLIGEKIILKAQETLKNSKEIQQLIEDEKGLIQGDFRLGIIPSVADGLIPKFLKEFTSTYPNVNLIINELQTDTLVKKLDDEEIDAGIAATPLNERGIIERELYYEPFFLYIHNEHFLSKKKLVEPQQLYNENILLMSEGHCFKTQALQVCSLDQSKNGINYQFESSNFQTIIQLVDQKMGITLLPYFVTKNLSLSKQSKNIKRIKGKSPVREVSLIYKRSVLKETILNAIYEIISKSIPEELKFHNKKRDDIISPIAIE